MKKLSSEEITKIHNAVWVDLYPSDWNAVNTVRDLLDHISVLESELKEYCKPVQETVTLSMATVDKLLVAAGWIPRGNGVSYGRNLEAATITYANGIFRWAWHDGNRVTNFNDLLRVK